MRFEKFKSAVRENAVLKPLVSIANSVFGGIRAPRRGRTDLPGHWGPSEGRAMSLPNAMRAVEISTPGGPEVLKLVERPVPQPRHGQILVKVAYAGVNRPDALQRAGSYAPPPTASDLPGLEASGTVAALGPGVTEWSVGDQVCALLPGGGYAEYAVTPAAHALPIPKGMDLKSAACLPETLFHRLDQRLHARRAEGRGAVSRPWRIIRHWNHGHPTGAYPGRPRVHHGRFGEKCETCLALGAERAINYREEDFVKILNAEGGANLILDMVGGDYLPRNIEALADDGRLVQIAFLQGPKVELNFAEVMVRRLTITGSTLRPQSDLAKARIARELSEKVWPLLDAGRIAPVMDSSFDLADAAKAHARLESSDHIGKIVLNVA